MKTIVLRASEVPTSYWESWSELQQADARFDSPYFRPEFTQAVAAARQDVEVAVLWQGGERVGFFPFQRHPGNVGVPVGEAMSDFHGVIARDDVAWEAEDLIRACQLETWKFDHLPAWQEAFQPYHLRSMISPYIDLSPELWAGDSGSNRRIPHGFSDVAKKWRKFCREVGPLRYEPDITGRDVFEALLEWKREQYCRTKAIDALAAPWKVALLERILLEQGEAFFGNLSALYTGDRLVAIHLGMQSFGVLHSWFPAYDVALGKYSPGLLLFHEMCKTASARGARRLDLGKGTQRFKVSLMSGAVQVAEGAIDFRFLARTARHVWYSTCQWLRSSPLKTPARAGLALVRPVQRWLALHKDSKGSPGAAAPARRNSS
jgi:CelD/BcsL family acetyltransferase involved in cellulose biosynthesis